MKNDALVRSCYSLDIFGGLAVSATVFGMQYLFNHLPSQDQDVKQWQPKKSMPYEY